MRHEPANARFPTAARDARPLRFWRDEQLRAVDAALRERFARWARAWGLDVAWPADGRRGTTAPADRQEQVLCLGRDGEAAAWLLPGPAFSADLRDALFGPGHAGPIAAEVADACERDLTRELASAFRLPGGDIDPLEPLPAESKPWSGQVTAHIALGARVVATAAAVENLLPAKAPDSAAAPRPGAAPLVAIAIALADTRISLHVQLQECDVDLGLLQRLRPGDVLRVPHRLDAPALVRTAGGNALFQGFLARSQRRRAVELVPLQ